MRVNHFEPWPFQETGKFHTESFHPLQHVFRSQHQQTSSHMLSCTHLSASFVISGALNPKHREDEFRKIRKTLPDCSKHDKMWKTEICERKKGTRGPRDCNEIGFELCELALEVKAGFHSLVIFFHSAVSIWFRTGQHDVQHPAPFSQCHCHPARQT